MARSLCYLELPSPVTTEPTPLELLMSTENRAHWSEDTACDYLQRQGMKLVCRNYNIRAGEIDLIMRDGSMLVFIEVRQRTRTTFGRPEETLDKNKQQKLRRVAEHYLQHHPASRNNPCRFDVFSITGRRGATKNYWIRNAF